MYGIPSSSSTQATARLSTPDKLTEDHDREDDFVDEAVYMAYLSESLATCFPSGRRAYSLDTCPSTRLFNRATAKPDRPARLGLGPRLHLQDAAPSPDRTDTGHSTLACITRFEFYLGNFNHFTCSACLKASL